MCLTPWIGRTVSLTKSSSSRGPGQTTSANRSKPPAVSTEYTTSPYRASSSATPRGSPSTVMPSMAIACPPMAIGSVTPTTWTALASISRCSRCRAAEADRPTLGPRSAYAILPSVCSSRRMARSISSKFATPRSVDLRTLPSGRRPEEGAGGLRADGGSADELGQGDGEDVGVRVHVRLGGGGAHQGHVVEGRHQDAAVGQVQVEEVLQLRVGDLGGGGAGA